MSELALELVSDDESDEDEYDDIKETSNRGRFLLSIACMQFREIASTSLADLKTKWRENQNGMTKPKAI